MDRADPDISTDTELQTLRKRARQQFIGAAILVVLAVAALPFVFSAKPRPISPDIAIDIKAPAAEKSSTPAEPVTSPPANPSPAQATPPLAFKPEPAAKAAPEPIEKPEPITKPAPVAKSESAAKSDEAVKANEAARAAALLNGGGYQIQAGSFTEKDKVQAMQDKLTKAGFQSTTQDAIAKDGVTHTRVRLGPYTTQQEANNVAARIGKLGIKTIVIKP